ncbi:MAG: hypothetical protein PHE67_07465 [Campylobacterales bacterium]|nr:hypothetical protein [Campylobacterales bacterium]
MITSEIGVEELFKSIFSVNDITNLQSCEYFNADSLQSIHILDDGYEAICQFLKQHDEISLELFIAINGTLAYGHPSTKITNEIEKYIKKYVDSIFLNLQYSIQDQTHCFSKQNSQYYRSIVEIEKITKILLDSLIGLCTYHTRLYNKQCLHVYGIKNLLLNLSMYEMDKFDTWFLQSEREDLKLIYAEAFLDSWHIMHYLLENHTNSKITFVRALAKLFYYNADRKLDCFKTSYSVADLDNNLEENIYFVLYSFLFMALDFRDSKKMEIIQNNIRSVSSHLQYLTIDIAREFYDNLQSYIFYDLIDKVQNEHEKNKLFSDFFEYLKVKLQHEQSISKISIENANVLGNLLLKLSEDNFDKFKKEIDALFEKINIPYFCYMFNDSWRKSIILIVHFLIGVFIYYRENQGSGLAQEEIKKFKAIKKKFNSWNDEKIGEILKQIEA